MQAAEAVGIAYLYGGDYEVIAHTIVNSLAIVSGIICDGAKASCAAKISAAVDAGIMGAMKCTYRDSSSMAVMESLPTVWKIPSGTRGQLAKEEDVRNG